MRIVLHSCQTLSELYFLVLVQLHASLLRLGVVGAHIDWASCRILRLRLQQCRSPIQSEIAHIILEIEKAIVLSLML